MPLRFILENAPIGTSCKHSELRHKQEQEWVLVPYPDIFTSYSSKQTNAALVEMKNARSEEPVTISRLNRTD